MSKPDGTIVFSTEMDNKELAKQVEEAKKEVKDIESQIDKLNKERSSAVKAQAKAQENLTKAQEEYNAALDKSVEAGEKAQAARAALQAAEEKQKQLVSDIGTSRGAEEKTRLSEELNSQMDTISQARAEWETAEAAAASYDGTVANAAQNVDAATANLRSADGAVAGIDASLSSANATLGEAEAKAGGLENQFKKAEARSKKLQKPIDKASAAVNKLGKRISRVAMSALVFSTLYKAFGTLKDRISEAVEQSEEASKAMAQLSGAAKTAAQPIVDALVPALTALAQALTRTIVLTGSLFGKDFIKDASDAAQALDKVKKARQDLAGFDEITTVGVDKEGSNSDYEFSDVVSGETENSVKNLARFTADLAIALGCVLVFSGANVPIGLALVALGAMAWVSELKEDWGSSENKVSTVAEAMLSMLGKFLLVIGCLLCFSGVSLPIGLAMIVAGAAIEAAVINWDTVTNALRGPIGTITAIASGALLVLGILLLLSGVGVGIGLGLILAGSAGLATVAAVNWDTIVNKVKSILKFLKDAIIDAFKTAFNNVKTTLGDLWSAVKQILNGIITFITGVFTGDWQKAWDGIKSIFTGIWNGMLAIVGNVVNSVISGLNWMIRQLNKISVDIPDWKIFGEYAGGKIGFDFQEIPKWDIPYLAQGAVLPANQPFLAMVGDQKHGTNVEAPLSTIQEAVRTELVAMFGNGFGTIDARLLAILDAIYGIDTSDERYARAVDNYNRREAIMGGV